MKRLILFLILLISTFIVQGVNSDNTFAVCDSSGGVKLCDTYYCCGVEDGVCPETWGATCSGSNNDVDCSELGCQPDCTNRGGECDHRCDGINGCVIPSDLYDANAVYMCEKMQPGVLVPYDANNELLCCIGPIVEEVEVTFTNAEDFEGTLVKYSKLVTYKGKPVRLVMVVWG